MRVLRAWCANAMGVAALAVVGAAALHVASAAEWQEPAAIPPAGNPPGFVWTQSPDATPQPGGQFHVAGSGTVGGVLRALGMSAFGGVGLDLGAGAGGQNVIYGAARYSSMHLGDALLLLQTADDTGNTSDRMRVDQSGSLTAAGKVSGAQLCIGAPDRAVCRDAWPAAAITEVRAGVNLAGGGDTGVVTLRVADTVTIEQDITAKRCFGPVIVGGTAVVNGALGGYDDANALCARQFSGSHLCTSEEVLRSIACGAFARIGIPVGARFWLAAGAPGFTAPANDCRGWTSNAADQLGPIWEYDANGGRGFLSSCDVPYAVGCCR